MVSRSTEIRHIPADVMQHISSRLNLDNAWKELALKIKDPSNPQYALYAEEHIYKIENRTSPAKALFEDWGTHGRIRPNIQDLIEVLMECSFLVIANYVMVDVLQEEPIAGLTTQLSFGDPPSESNQHSPSTPDVNHGLLLESNHNPQIDESLRQISLNSTNDDLNENILDRQLLRDPELSVFSRNKDNNSDLASRHNITLPCLSYEKLHQMTNEFDEKEISMGGRKLGSGAFGIVYLGIDSTSKKVAVKKFIDKTREKLFWNEIDVMSKFSHDNLLRMLSYSVDGSNWCIVYEYMENGSLYDTLARKENNLIPWNKRTSIATEISHGLAFLHGQNYIHRDIKSANILLTHDLVPKLGDFGIIHTGPDSKERSQTNTIHIMGANLYMAPEAFHGVVSIKLDTYSFGVVLLELLTGRKPYTAEKKEALPSFINEHCQNADQIIQYLDPLAGSWDHDIAKELFNLSVRCTEMKQHERPTVAKIVPEFEALSSKACKMN